MAISDDVQSAVDTIIAVVDALGFLDPGVRALPDDDLVVAIAAHVDTLRTVHSVTLETRWRGATHEPSAAEMADWLFDGYPPSEHALSFIARNESGDAVLTFTTDVPFPWRL